MTLLAASKTSCMWVFWTVYVRSTILQTSYRCRKQVVNSKVQVDPFFSVLEHNLVSCTVTCDTETNCNYLVYNRHTKLCHGFGEAACDGDGNDAVAGDSIYQIRCKGKCPRKKAIYKLTIVTGKKRYSDSKADLTVHIAGPCGHVSTAIRNGKDVKLRRGRASKFRFVDDSVCGVERIDLALANHCNTDDWFVAIVEVEYQEMATGDRHWVEFTINHWLSASEEDNYITGIRCVHVPEKRKMSAVVSRERSECQPSQICED